MILLFTLNTVIAVYVSYISKIRLYKSKHNQFYEVESKQLYCMSRNIALGIFII